MELENLIGFTWELKLENDIHKFVFTEQGLEQYVNDVLASITYCNIVSLHPDVEQHIFLFRDDTFITNIVMDDDLYSNNMQRFLDYFTTNSRDNFIDDICTDH